MRDYEFPKVFRSLLKNRNMTQSKFAWDNYFDPKTVNYWCKDKRRPSIDSLMYIADALGVSLDYLVYGPEPEVDFGEFETLKNVASLIACLKKKSRTKEELEAYNEVLSIIRDEIRMKRESAS